MSQLSKNIPRRPCVLGDGRTVQVPMWIQRIDTGRGAGWQTRLGVRGYAADSGRDPMQSLKEAKAILAERLSDPEIASRPNVRRILSKDAKGLRRRLNWGEQDRKLVHTGHTGVRLEVRVSGVSSRIRVITRLIVRHTNPRLIGITVGDAKSVTLAQIKAAIQRVAAVRQWTIDRASQGLATPPHMIDFEHPHDRVLEIKAALPKPKVRKADVDAEVLRAEGWMG